MKKFQFRLQTVLEVRERIKETKEQELAQINHQWLQLIEAKEGLESVKEGHLEAHTEAQQGSMDIDTVLWFQQYAVVLEKRIQEATQAIESAKRRREEKRLELIHATQECEVLVKLKERDYQQYLKALDREENLLLDELSTSRYNRKE